MPFFLWRSYRKITGWWYGIELRLRYMFYTSVLTARIARSWLRLRLTRFLVRLSKSRLKNLAQTETTAPVAVRSTTLHYYESSNVPADGPMAVVRFTAYDEHGVPLAVRQEMYQDDPEGFSCLEYEVSEALENEIDVVIYSDREPRDFPVVSSYLDA